MVVRRGSLGLVVVRRWSLGLEVIRRWSLVVVGRGSLVVVRRGSLGLVVVRRGKSCGKEGKSYGRKEVLVLCS